MRHDRDTPTIEEIRWTTTTTYARVALTIETVSPGDQTWGKLAFYAAHQIDELLIVDPDERRVHWLGLTAAGEYRPLDQSGLIALGPEQVTEAIRWPQ